MTNKKKTKTTKSANNKAPASSSPSSSTPTGNTPYQKGLSPPQLTALIFMSMGVSYLMEYGKAVKEGIDSTSCAEYYNNTMGSPELRCTATDVVLIQAKYYGAMVCCTLVTTAMLLVWYDPALFTTLNVLLCISPLSTTLVGLHYFTHDELKEGRIWKMSMTCILLLVVALSSKMKLAKFDKRRISSLQHVCLLSLSLLYLKEAWEFGSMEHVTDYVYDASNNDDDNNNKSLLTFLAIDKITMALLMGFVMLFLDDNRKRTMLLVVALTKVAELYWQLPQLEHDLVHATDIHNVVLGSAIFAAIAAFMPHLSWNSNKNKMKSS